MTMVAMDKTSENDQGHQVEPHDTEPPYAPTEEQPPSDAPVDAPATEPDASSGQDTNIITDPVDTFTCSACECRIDASGLTAFTPVDCPACGSHETVPAQLGNFLLLKLLGTGGMGGVYYAQDESLGRYVAIKVMLQSLGDDEAFVETFRHEAQAVAKLNHPNIAQIYSFGQEKGQPYIVMELVSGERVDDMMEAPDGVSPVTAMRIGLQIARGLSAADEAGLVHGDIKPENILLDIKGQAKLVDFGLATVAHAASSEGIWGTPYYIAPEKVRRQKIDARADIYSLGATLYHILTNKPPFEGETHVEVVKARLDNPPPDIKAVLPDLPDKVAGIITRMLAVERTERYPTYKSLISDLQKAVEILGGNTTNQTSRLGGKQIRIKKKRSSASVSSGTTGNKTPPADSSGGRKRKIVIRKDRPASAISQKTAPTKTGENEASEPEPKPEPTPAELAQKRLKRKRLIKTAWMIGSIMVALGIAGGIATYYIKRQQAIIAKRAEWHARTTAQKEAKQFYNTITAGASDIEDLVTKTKNYENDARAAFLDLTGSELILTPPPAPAPTTEPPEATGGATTNATTNVTDTAKTNTTTSAETTEPESDATGADEASATEADATAPEAPPAADADTPATNATAEASSEDKDGRATPDSEKAEGSDATAAAETQEPEADITFAVSAVVPLEKIDEALDPIERAVRMTVLNVQRLQTTHRQSGAILELAAAAHETARQTQSSRSALKKRDLLATLADQAAAQLKSAKALYDATREGYEQVQELKAEHDAEIATQRQAEQEAQRHKEAQARKAREEKAYQEKVEREQQAAQADHGSVTELFQKHQFSAVVQALEQKRNNYNTKAGLAALERYIDRFEYALTMQKELIKNINSHPFAWGWGSGTSARDVVNASREGITVKGKSAIIPWEHISIAKMLRFADHYLDLRETRISSKANIAIGAAVYCDEFGKEGRAKAKTYLNRALGYGFSSKTKDRLFGSDW